MDIQHLSPLSVDDFETYYAALYEMKPFQWQSRLVRQVCSDGWPAFIQLPTASGKTATLDIAIFSLAYHASQTNRIGHAIKSPRRIFFVVDRRIVVSEAYRRASATASKLRSALVSNSANFESPHSQDILLKVARWLKVLADDETAPPLDCFELRGGIYRNDAWVRSMLQPTVLTSTVDQIGSRILFRGYGVANTCLSIHAALTANDSLIILDEAHCARPFSQTLSAIAAYRSEKWCAKPLGTPFQFVQMTATPSKADRDNDIFRLTAQDYEADRVLDQRHACTKPIRLLFIPGAKGTKLTKILSTKIVEQAIQLNTQNGCKKIAVVVNRIAIARECFAELEKRYPGRVHLMIGRMRPYDRDRLTQYLQSEFGAELQPTADDSINSDPPQFVVATQCLEVGADLDFDGMVSQCASLDALRQRFGRLNRLGQTPYACGVIVAPEGDIVPLEKIDAAKPVDPIYGNALVSTWHWLIKNSDTVSDDDSEPEIERLGSRGVSSDEGHRNDSHIDFGVKSFDLLLQGNENLHDLLAPAEDAPVLMPAHLDMLCQTSQRPMPEPDIPAYLHGPNRGLPEVLVCWRADLDLSTPSAFESNWSHAVGLCPPSTKECLAVPLPLFRKWLCGEKVIDLSGDVLGEQSPADDDENRTVLEREPMSRTVLVWRGTDRMPQSFGRGSFCADRNCVNDIRPNDTIVIPVEFGGWKSFGHIPDAPLESTRSASETYRCMMANHGDGERHPELSVLATVDIASEAILESLGKSVFRAHPKLVIEPHLQPLAYDLLIELTNENADLSLSVWRDIKAVALRDEVAKSLPASTDRTAPTIVRLTEWHDGKVKGRIVRYSNGVMWITDRHPNLTRSNILPLPTFGDEADELQNVGKISLHQHLSDVESEAQRLVSGMNLESIIGSTILNAAKLHDLGKADPRFQAMLIAKPIHAAYMQPILWAKSDIECVSYRSTLPHGFRHEALSTQLCNLFDFTGEMIDRPLMTHLVASHHGYARPFMPVCIDKDPIELNFASLGGCGITAAERAAWKTPHLLDSGISDQFWALNRTYGWWGLAFLEATLRLADWKASANPGSSESLADLSKVITIPKKKDHSPNGSSVLLSGLDGSNPLAYLAALGTFRTLAIHAPELDLRMSWNRINGAWRPAIDSPSDCDLSEQRLLDLLEKHLEVDESRHPALRLADSVDSIGILECFKFISQQTSIGNRFDADWLTCNWSHAADPSSISQLQTSRRDYHSINIKGLLATTNISHLHDSLFKHWTYSDPIAGVSLHLEPREDRRHAYQWHMPSGDPTRSSSGGMIGANRLALEAWPFFQSLPSGEKLVTVGFRGQKANNTRFFWPIWDVPIGMETLQSLLSVRIIDSTNPEDISTLQAMAVSLVYSCRRILVGKTPNLTSSEPWPSR